MAKSSHQQRLFISDLLHIMLSRMGRGAFRQSEIHVCRLFSVQIRGNAAYCRAVGSIPLPNRRIAAISTASGYESLLPLVTNATTVTGASKEDVHLGPFERLGISPELAANLAREGISNPTQIQIKAVGPILAQKNVIVTAETGSGKTLAYLLPLLTHLLQHADLSPSRPKSGCAPFSPRLLLLVPTRELCVQMLRVLQSITKGLNVTATLLPPPPSVPLTQIRYPDVAVSTPAAIARQFSSPRSIKELLYRTDAIVVDEADWTVADPTGWKFIAQMASISRKRETLETSSVTPIRKLQFIFAAATLPPIRAAKAKTPRALIQRTFQDVITVGTTALHMPPAGLKERFIRLVDADDQTLSDDQETQTKCNALMAILVDAMRKKAEANVVTSDKWLVFCNSTKRAEQVFAALSATQDAIIAESGLGVPSMAFEVNLVHGDVHRDERGTTVLNHVVKNNHNAQPVFKILVSTDLVARGLDFVDVSTVVQLDFARDAATYLHRIGRTARAGKAGQAISFVSPSDYRLSDFVERASKGVADSKLQTHAQFRTALLGDAEVLREDDNDRTPLTALFSRNRSFRNKLRKKQMTRHDSLQSKIEAGQA
ncbi:uncharacterized protein SPPG_05927 [Spizellomyces punctatus DAOM BR117]|uniref:ATP-dependent RNA helicase n=1 Tax=Spizellomyces punctatus (strain DAOM BR117) TaxID=645134 RepID=A0A0L0HD77_SPIPD|nr:uncharacterized protein SPPG_05927 [Spizellomyces punctatus DAOM BR117]KNC98971.1 hypothetical protein SPPG_05927 [Spizellomyces punctatus DAOM BR117]|eukprot:XP_016607011.1 hypothetical protein SPPG_05927 [Spizellomyces punctatus DAOM BR117]